MAVGYKIHIVGPGDTIQAIGDLYGVPWTQICTINGLSYPFINTEPESGDNSIPADVATVGRQLVIPTGDMIFPVRIDDAKLDVVQYILGADLDIYSCMESEHHVIQIGNTGELLDDGHGDLLLASGLRNLRQQLVTRLGTPKGTLLLHPEYGSDILQYIGRPLTPELLVEQKLCVQECLLTDFRVEGISDLTVEKPQGMPGTLIHCLVHAIDPFGVFRLNAMITESGTSVVD